MVDVKDHLAEPSSGMPITMDRSDIRPHAADGSCLFCKGVRRERAGESGQDSTTALFENYNLISLEKQYWDSYMKNDETHVHFLCPDVVSVFVFKTRQWGTLLSWPGRRRTKLTQGRTGAYQALV
jgi:hypothetical protein